MIDSVPYREKSWMDKHNIAFAMSHLKWELAPYAIVGGDEDLAGKPEPAIFLEAAKRMGVEAAKCIFFEDAPFGIEAACRSGPEGRRHLHSHSAQELRGSHVLVHVHDYNELMNSNFLESLHAS